MIKSKDRGTRISWTDQTWNPTSGCSKVSEGCRYCYAETLSLRFKMSPAPWTAENAAQNVVCHPDRLAEISKLKRPSRIFVNSMSDLFHPLIPADYISDVFAVMAAHPQHTFQILTKRPERAANWAGPWPEHIWMGTSIESQRHVDRADAIRRCGAAVKFISAEPLLEPFEIDLSGIDWVIAGGESGSLISHFPERWMDHAWARAIRDQAVAAGCAFYFKQSSGWRSEMGVALREADGSLWLWHQYPGELSAPVQVQVTDSPSYRIPTNDKTAFYRVL